MVYHCWLTLRAHLRMTSQLLHLTDNRSGAGRSFTLKQDIHLAPIGDGVSFVQAHQLIVFCLVWA